MKVLIVDDNVAVQGILRDILEEEGHDIHVASSVDEAVSDLEGSHPDIVMLDTWVGDEDGMRLISRAHEVDEDMVLNVILIKSASEQVPKDNPYIKGYLDKPFMTADVLTVLRETRDRIEDTRPVSVSKKRRGPLLRKRKVERIPVPSTNIMDETVRFGTSYVMFETAPDAVYRFAGLFNPTAYDVLIITSDKVKAVRQRFESERIEVVSMTATHKAGAMDILNLGSLVALVRGFVSGHDRPVVVIDNFSTLVEANGLNKVLVMLHELTGDRTRETTFVASVDPSILTDKDRNIILHEMKQFNFRK